MRLFVLDSGLRARGSHNLVFAILVSAAARKRGIEATAFTSKVFKSDPDDPFEVRALFSASYYDAVSADPVSRPVYSYNHLNKLFLRELKTIPQETFATSDVVWIPTISERHLQGLCQWIGSFEPARAPQFVVTLTLPPGVSTALGDVSVYDSLQAVHYRNLLVAARRLGANVHFVATGDPIASDYSYLAQRPIPAHPVLIDPNLELTPATGRTLLVYVGDAAIRKGIHLLPQAVRLMAARLPGWKLLAHINDGETWSPKRPGAALRALQQSIPSLEIRSGFLDPDEHRRLFEQASVVLLAYEKAPYSRGMSGVLWEAIAAGRPMILPAGTYLEHEAEHWGASYAAIDSSRPKRIADGVAAALESGALDYDKSFRAAQAFREVNGVERFVDYLVALPGAAKAGPKKSRNPAPPARHPEASRGRSSG